MSREVSLPADGAALHPVSSALGLSKSITYGELSECFEGAESARLEAEGKSQKRVKNLKTTMNSWWRHWGLTEDSRVGNELLAGFTESFEDYATALADDGKSQQTIADRKSIMNGYRETCVGLLQSSTVSAPEGDFAEVLYRFIESSGIPVNVVARDAGVPLGTLLEWRTGRAQPNKRSLPKVHRLEEILNLSPGILVAKLPKVLLGDTPVSTCQTGFRKHSSEVCRLKYLLKEFPPTLQGEWDDLFRFHTDAAWLKMHGLTRNSKWRIRMHDDRCPTAARVRQFVSEFMGYLCLPPDAEDPRLRGMGFRPEELTLAMFSDSSLVYNFIQFKRERTYLKRYNGNTFRIFSFCSSLLRKQTGFLWQLPDLGTRLPVPVPAADWHAWCERHRSVIRSAMKELSREDEFKKTRDPFEPIGTIILNNQHPLDVLFKLAADYEADAPPAALCRTKRPSITRTCS